MSLSGALPLSCAPTARRVDWANVVAWVLSCVIFAGLSGVLAFQSDSDLEADATTHFLFARFSLREHHYLVSVWGRPLCTLAYALTARIGTVEQGRQYARLTSLGLAMIAAVVTYLIAKRQGFRRPILAFIFLLAQPIFFLHSFSELTEIPFAVILMLAFLAYQRRQWFAMALLTGILPLGRPEGFGFIMMAAVALLAHRRARWWIVLPLPFLAWSFAGYYITSSASSNELHGWQWILNREWFSWVFRHWPYSYRSTYGSGSIVSFLGRLPVLVSPLIFPFVLVGIGVGLRGVSGERARSFRVPQDDNRRHVLQRYLAKTHEQRCEIWIVLIPLSILIVHSLIWWKGLMGSNGELRYLVIVGPFFAMIAARGWEWAWPHFEWKAPLFWAGVVSLLPMTVNLFYRVLPFPLYEDGLVARDVARWYTGDEKLRRNYPKIMPTPPGIAFFMDLSQSDSAHAIAASKMSIGQAPPGVLLVWDAIYGQHNSSADMCVPLDLIEKAGWVHLRRFERGDRYCEVFLSPENVRGEKTTVENTFNSGE